MNLQEALNKLEDGIDMCRAAWTLEDGYLTLMPGMTHIWKIVLKPTPNAGNYIFSYEDLMANDWKEFQLSPEVEVEVVV